MKPGAVEFLTKRINEDLLLDAIRRSRDALRHEAEDAGSSMRTDTKVSPILSSDRSEVASLVSWVSKGPAMLSHAAMFRSSGVVVLAVTLS